MKKYISNYIKSIALSTVLFGTCVQGYSQDQKQEFSVSVGGPFSFAKPSSAGELVSGNGFSAGLRYSYYLNEGLSVGVGAEYQTYNTEIKFKTLGGGYKTADAESESFEFRYNARNFREEQKMSYINVPIGIQFETPGSTKFYLAAGAKIGFALKTTYQSTAENLTTSGYYPQYNVELFNPSFAGFSSANDLKIGKQDFDTKISYSATLETGLKHSIGDNRAIYIGVYFDHILNNIHDKTADKNLIQYSSSLPVELQYNSVYDSGIARQLRLVSYGLKLRFAIYH